MVLITRRNSIRGRISSRSKLLGTILAGVTFLILPILIKILDPIQVILNYKLRLAKGSMLYELLQHEIVGARLSINVFNITNAERFLSGKDYKIKVKEVGPFVFQEYRWFEDMEVSEDGTELSMTPKIRSEFVAEASLAHPKDVNLTLANLPFLSATAMMSNYPTFARMAFNMMAAQLGTKPIFNIDVHNYLWGYENPVVTISNSLAPGIIYFNKLGILDRLYDAESDYRVTVGATNSERFKLKSVKKFRHIQMGSIQDVEQTEQTFDEDTYEGIGYPPPLSPEMPINLYRLGICKSWGLEYTGVKPMDYGGEGLVYTLSNKTFSGGRSPVTQKPYPEGLMDISKCYYNLPFAVSKGHLLDVDPKILERIDGLHPNRKEHSNEFVIDYKVSVPYAADVSLQLNMMVDDVSFNSDTKMLSNTVIPVIHLKLIQPRLPENTIDKFRLVHQIAPKIVLAVSITMLLIGLTLLSRAVLLIYRNWVATSRSMIFEPRTTLKLMPSNVPLIKD